MFPLLSIVIPTLNSAKVLEKCLVSISKQKYPKKKIEVIVVDGGSIDETINIAKKYKAKIFSNPLKTGEAGKAVGVKKATGELVAFIDSDNILPVESWLNKMVDPFSDLEILVSEPWKYTYRKSDPWLTRYFAMLGMNDPICLFLGNYDRISLLGGKWTNLIFVTENKKDYLKIKLDHEPLPTIGANGTIFRRENLKNTGDYFFDVDIIANLLRNKKTVCIAKVKTGIIHTFVEGDVLKFFRKQRRRMDDMSYHRARGGRTVDWEKLFLKKIIYFQIQCFFIFPILFQTFKGFLKKPDPAWIFHPLACYSTWFIYLYGWVRGKISPIPASRKNWKQ